MGIRWLNDIRANDVGSVGGKGASLGELTRAGLPVPPGFVVTADTYRAFIDDAGIAADLFEAVEVDPEDGEALAAAEERARELILGTPMPDAVREDVLQAYDGIGEEPFVAVRSSATAEDLPEASFAGQQETFLNVTRDGLVDAVRECWASLFTQRAIAYRERQGFAHREVDIAVVVQQMVDAEKSGVLFTKHPSTGDPRTVIEAAFGLGEAVVSGTVSPDNYVVDAAGELVEETVATQNRWFTRDPETGETVERDLPEEKRDVRVLTDDEIDRLVDLGKRVEDHYEQPQDVEWAIVGGDLYVLQSRPITTIDRDAGGRAAESEESGAVLLSGLGGSPGRASGPVRIVTQLDQLDKVGKGDVMVTRMTTPDMVPAMQRAAAIVTDEGGVTSHAAIVSRELGVPAVLGTRDATTRLSDGQVVTVDGERGQVTAGEPERRERETEDEPERRTGATKPLTATEIKVNLSVPDAGERAAETTADGVGLFRMEHFILMTNKTPRYIVENEGAEAYVDVIVDGIRQVAEPFYPRPVRVRTLDAPSDEFRQLEGGIDEPREHNPMLGYRGIRRSQQETDLFGHELAAFKKLYELGYDNVEIMFPLVNDVEDVRWARERLVEAGIDPEKREWGVMVETPAAALTMPTIAAETDVDFASFGTNDLTQYTLAVDRNNENVADRYDELHPAVLSLVGDTIETCREHGVATSICGQAGSKPEMVRYLVEAGISSISVNIDALTDVQQLVKRTEQRFIIESVRD
ncbi:MAG: pyruvate, water dikinase [Halobacteriaceae archaeon]